MLADAEEAPILATPSGSQRYDPTGKPNNWPICYPFTYHNLKEIREPSGRRAARHAYLNCYLLILVFLVNFVALCMVPNHNSDFLIDVFIALGILIVGTIVVFAIYRLCYIGFRDLASSSLVLYMFLFGAQIAFEAILSLGLRHSGGAGLVRMFALIKDKHMVGALAQLAGFSAWLLAIAHGAFVLYKVKRAHSRLGDETGQEEREAVQKIIGNAQAPTPGYNSTIASGQPTLTIEPRSAPPSSNGNTTSGSGNTAATRKSQADPISQALWDNRDAIGQAIFDNREVIANNAVAVGKWGYENRETVVAAGRTVASVVPPEQLSAAVGAAARSAQKKP